MPQKSWIVEILFKSISDNLFKKFPGFYDVKGIANTNQKIQPNVKFQDSDYQDNISESADMIARLLVDHL
ncbi:MAG: hypothetical protein ACRCZI_08430 [Cetobacterium sp.]